MGHKKRYTTGDGLNLTDPYVQSLAGQNSNKRTRKSGKALSNKDLIEMDFSQRQLQQKNDFTEYMYNQYQSPQAMMRQYAEAGLNPALMYEGAGSGSPVQSNSEGGMSLGNTSEENPSSVMSAISSIFTPLLNAIGLKSEIDERQSAINANNAKAGKDIAETSGINIDNSYKDMKNILELAESSGRITHQQLENSLLDLSLLRESDPEVFAARKEEILQELNLTKEKVGLTKAQKEESQSSKAFLDFQKTHLENVDKREKELFSFQKKDLKAHTENLEKSTEYIGKQISLCESQKDFVDMQKSVQEQIRDNYKLRAEFDKYAKDHNIPLGDYMAIALFKQVEAGQYLNGNITKDAAIKELRGILWDLHRKGQQIGFGDIESLQYTAPAVTAVANAAK